MTPGVFYCKDAFEGLDVMDKLIDPTEARRLVGRIIAEAYEEMGRIGRPRPASDRAPVEPAACASAYAAFLGHAHHPRNAAGERAAVPVQAGTLPPEWGAKNTQGEEWERLKAEFEARLARMKREAIRNRVG